MHNVLQAYYHEDPANRFSHIPSVVVPVPVKIQTQHDLCFSSRYLREEAVLISGDDIRALAAALLAAVRELEPDSDAQTIQQTNQENESKPIRKYFIKRNYSGVLTVTIKMMICHTFKPASIEHHNAEASK